MKINKNKVLHHLKSDLKAAEVLRKEWDAKIDKWKREYNGEPYGNEVKNKSVIVSRDIKKQSEWQHATIIDPFVSSNDIIKCTPVTAEDRPASRQAEIVLNAQFTRQFNRYTFMTKAVKVLDMEGTVVIQTGWDYEAEDVEQEVPVVSNVNGVEHVIGYRTEVVPVVTRNRPTAIVCRNEDIFVDPTCMDELDKAQFIIHRYETDMSTLRRDGRYRNLDKISAEQSGYDPDFKEQDSTNFRFSDGPRKKLVVYEYWGNYDINEDGVAEPIVCAWVGNTIIRLQDNPYPDKKPPFLIVAFNSVPFQIFGEANAELISDNQKIKTGITRGIIDNMANSNNGQKGVRKGALDPTNRARFLKGENFEFNNTRDDFWDGGYNQIPGSVFDMLALQNNEIESLTGVKGFSNGINGSSLGHTATGARGALDATSTRRLNIVRNIAENLIKPLMRKWLAYNTVFLHEVEIVRYTNEEFVEIRRDDLEGNIDIDITVSTAEDNAAKAQELGFLLQTLGPTEDPKVRRGLMADIYELMRMPDKAAMLREYQPQPDPYEEKLKELELEKRALENMRIKAEIQDKLMRTAENDVDRRLKMARMKSEDAKAEVMLAESHMKNLQFLEKESGYDHQKELEKRDIAHQQALEKQVNETMLKLQEKLSLGGIGEEGGL